MKKGDVGMAKCFSKSSETRDELQLPAIQNLIHLSVCKTSLEARWLLVEILQHILIPLSTSDTSLMEDMYRAVKGKLEHEA